MELEHSAISIATASKMCGVPGDLGITPFVRIPERDYGIIGRLLDAGALGIIAPCIESVRRNLAGECTHLGCPIRWEASAELFMCPCHGGVYYKDGQVAAGPPPHSLQQFPVRILNNSVKVEWRKLPAVAGSCPHKDSQAKDSHEQILIGKQASEHTEQSTTHFAKPKWKWSRSPEKYVAGLRGSSVALKRIYGCA